MMENPTYRPAVDPLDQLGGRRGGRESVIDQDCFFEGTFRTPGNMRVEGTCQGVIECQGTLTIAESGRVNARIAAGSLVIAGQLEGEAQCESRFEVLKSGRVHGTIVAKTTVIHDGAFFEGEIRMSGERATSDRAHIGPSLTERRDAPPRAADPTPPVREPVAATASRRRPAAESAPHSDIEEDVALAGVQPEPKVNGRGQAASRDVLPNRTGEA